MDSSYNQPSGVVVGRRGYHAGTDAKLAPSGKRHTSVAMRLLSRSAITGFV